MAKDSDHLAGSFEIENTGGVLAGLLAEEDPFDRRTLWRLGSWGSAAVGTLIVAALVNQSSIKGQREQVASADLARQSQQIQSVAKESQNETRRLASAIDTLNGDRDRLYARVTVLEQGLDSVTGAIARQPPAAVAPPTVTIPSAPTEQPSAAKEPVPAPLPTPVVSAVTSTVAKKAEKPPAETAAEQGPATVSSVAKGAASPPAAAPATSLMASKSIMAPPDAAATKLIEPEKPKLIEPEKPANALAAVPKPDVVASAPPADSAASDSSQALLPKVAIQRTEFGVDVGGANSVAGLRALWRGLLKSKSNAALTTLSPIIVIREGSNGLGMQLRLVAGPLNDAAAAAKICAGLTESERSCQTTVYEGQRLAMKAEEPAANAPNSTPVKPVARRRTYAKQVTPNAEPPKAPDPPSTLSSLFGRR